MTNINLLPWREELREERKREFLVALGVVVAVAFLLLFAVDRYFNGAINAQKNLNNYLGEQIVVLDAKLVEIRELRKQKAELTERMSVIQDLQGTRPVIVRLFDEMVRTLPEGVYYKSVVRSGDGIRFEGVAESNSKVSELMRRLDESEWFVNPALAQVTATSTDGSENIQENSRSAFLLNVTVTTPDPEQ